MRTAPVALAYLGDDDAIVPTAMEISGLTHADPVAGEACVIWCVAIDRAIREGRLDGVRDGIALCPRISGSSGLNESMRPSETCQAPSLITDRW
jgi:ADP-ribosylglycohydrolase